MDSADFRLPRRGVMTDASLLWTVFGRRPAKQIESGLVAMGVECTSDQAERIAKTGYVPKKFKAAVLELLDRSVERRAREIEEARQRLRELRREIETGEAPSGRAAHP